MMLVGPFLGNFAEEKEMGDLGSGTGSDPFGTPNPIFQYRPKRW